MGRAAEEAGFWADGPLSLFFISDLSDLPSSTQLMKYTPDSWSRDSRLPTIYHPPPSFLYHLPKCHILHLTGSRRMRFLPRRSRIWPRLEKSVWAIGGLSRCKKRNSELYRQRKEEDHGGPRGGEQGV